MNSPPNTGTPPPQHAKTHPANAPSTHSRAQGPSANGLRPLDPRPPPVPDFPPLPWTTRRIVVSHTINCPHCGGSSFLLDPDIGATCVQCAKPPNSLPQNRQQETSPP